MEMENRTFNNDYMHLVHFLSEESQDSKSPYDLLHGNVEMIVILVHMVRKDAGVYKDSPR